MYIHLTHTSPSAGPGPDGGAASAAEVARQERRVRRLATLENVREMNETAALRLIQLISGMVQPEDCPALARIADPSQALVRVSRAIRQIVALEEKIDESDEARAERRKAEQAARDKALREAEAKQDREAVEARREARKKAVRRAVRDAHREAEPDYESCDRDQLIDDLFEDYDDYGDDDDRLDMIVGRMCAELGIEPPEAVEELDFLPPDDSAVGVGRGVGSPPPGPGSSPGQALPHRGGGTRQDTHPTRGRAKGRGPP